MAIQDELHAYEEFLSQILQATSESNADAKVIFPMLAANTDKLNHIFAELLKNWATNTFTEAELDVTTDIAGDIFNFSNRIYQFPLGSRNSNIEIAITGYEIALTIFTRTAFPENWAATQNNLATAYSDRIKGEKADNLEKAIVFKNFYCGEEAIAASSTVATWQKVINRLK